MMAKVTQKTKTEKKTTTDKTRASLDTQKARESLLKNKSGVCPFCGHKM